MGSRHTECQIRHYHIIDGQIEVPARPAMSTNISLYYVKRATEVRRG